MKRILFTIVSFFITIAVLAQNHAEDNLVSLPINDQEMTIAIIKARSTFSEFLQAFADKNSGATNFSIKYPFEAYGSYEHIWLDRIAVESGKIIGYVNNEPQKTARVEFNEKVVINPSKISDWMYFIGGKMVGCTSLEVIKARQMKQQNTIADNSYDIGTAMYQNDPNIEDFNFDNFIEKQAILLEKQISEAINSRSLKDQDSSIVTGAKSPVFENYENREGGTSSLTDFEGKYVYIDIWATWCPPCKKEIPFLQELQNDFEGSDIEFVSISVDDPKGKQGSKEAWINMIENQNLSGTQLFADKGLRSDFIKAYRVNSIPRFILIDPEGNVVDANAKRPSDPMLKDELRELGI